MELLLRPETYVSLLTLTSLEIVLGIDNIIFISILVGRVPKERREVIRRTGLALALFSRLGLLFSISWVMSLESELFAIVGNSISGKDLILIGGGLFLLGKATHEIYENVERPAEHQATSMD
ncbi:MAG: TerC family protein, partial [Gammaproteobacteria bacterium]|nr:TerC family protein [Gammaproteobacteria bacterium]